MDRRAEVIDKIEMLSEETLTEVANFLDRIESKEERETKGQRRSSINGHRHL